MTAYRVGLLAPMQLELAPMVRDLGLFETESGVWRGITPSGVEIVAVCTNIGMEAARNATNAILELDVDYVIVAGIAGATSTATNIGSLIVPAFVVDRSTGRAFAPTPRASNPPLGTISCGDDLITDASILETMATAGVVALDMESAAVGEVCEEAGCPWSVFRAISDQAGAGLIDDAG